MSSGATSHLWGFITSLDYILVNDSLPLLKFRLAFTRYDFQSKKKVTEFLPVTAFSKSAERIFSAINSGLNYICCHCDIKVSSFTSKSGAQVQFQEHVINDFRLFSKFKADSPASATPQSQAFSPESQPFSAQPFPQDNLPQSSQSQAFSAGDVFSAPYSNGSSATTSGCCSPAANGDSFSSDPLDLPY
jgi:single-stranded DNA-binding protein